VIGIDFSEAFIDVANDLKKNGQRTFKLKHEGDTYHDFIAKRDSSVDI
jgi:hypothetical protein